MNKNTNKRFKVGKTERELLYEISAGDMFVGFLLSCRSTRLMYKVAHNRAKQRAMRKRALLAMEKKGLVRMSGERIALTKLAKGILNQYHITDILSKNKQKWDKRWRVISFDIPNNMSNVRFMLRKMLQDAGFLKVQQSVYVYPHKCDELLKFIESEKKWSKYITFMIVEYSNNNDKWKKEFKHLFA